MHITGQAHAGRPEQDYSDGTFGVRSRTGGSTLQGGHHGGWSWREPEVSRLTRFFRPTDQQTAACPGGSDHLPSVEVLGPWPNFLRVGQEATVSIRFRRPLNGAALAWGGLDLEGDGQPGFYMGNVQEDLTKPQTMTTGLDRVQVMGFTVTAKSLPPSGGPSGPYNLLAKVVTVEGCMATTGRSRQTVVTP